MTCWKLPNLIFSKKIEKKSMKFYNHQDSHPKIKNLKAPNLIKVQSYTHQSLKLFIRQTNDKIIKWVIQASHQYNDTHTLEVVSNIFETLENPDLALCTKILFHYLMFNFMLLMSIHFYIFICVINCKIQLGSIKYFILVK